MSEWEHVVFVNGDEYGVYESETEAHAVAHRITADDPFADVKVATQEPMAVR